MTQPTPVVAVARTPAEIHARLADAMNQGNLEAAVSLYESQAVFVPQPGQSVHGHAAIRRAMQEFLAMKPSLSLTVTQVLQSGDVALLSSSWTLRGTGPDGTPVELTGRGAEVVRRQADGTWRFLIDNPYGG